jgi:hypothetical protein
MRAASLCALPFAFALACSSGSQPPEQATTQAEPTSSDSPEKRPSFDQRRPFVGDPAPPLSLETLAGGRVSLPGSNADRAAVLIFGSFS